jgi:hypothetical protein
MIPCGGDSQIKSVCYRRAGGNSHVDAGVVPMGRIGRSEEIAKAVVWLRSDAASFVTGHTLRGNGGDGAGKARLAQLDEDLNVMQSSGLARWSAEAGPSGWLLADGCLETLEDGFQFGQVHRLDHVQVDAALLRVSAGSFFAKASHGDDEGRLFSRLALQLSRHVVPAHPRQSEVKEHHIRAMRPRPNERFWAVVGDAHLMPVHAEQQCNGLCPVCLIINNKDIQPGRRINGMDGRN